MAINKGDRPSQQPARETELLPSIMAIALAVVAQLALQDGVTILGVVGYVVAVWLFLLSVRGQLDGRLAATASARPDAEAPAVQAGQLSPGASRLAYLRQHWRQVTLAEIFQGDIPPARLQGQETSALAQAGPAVEAGEELVQTAIQEEKPAAHAAHFRNWAAPDSPASAPRAVKVTRQGDVLVLDLGLEQVLRFDEAGKLLATYPLTGLAGLEILDMAVSADGRTLYVIDAASNHLQVITLSDQESGEEE